MLPWGPKFPAAQFTLAPQLRSHQPFCNMPASRGVEGVHLTQQQEAHNAALAGLRNSARSYLQCLAKDGFSAGRLG
jgi:hypothetical protein